MVEDVPRASRYNLGELEDDNAVIEETKQEDGDAAPEEQELEPAEEFHRWSLHPLQCSFSLELYNLRIF